MPIKTSFSDADGQRTVDLDTVDLGNGLHALKTVSVASDGGAGAAILLAGTDRSGSITLGGTAQPLAAANTARRGLRGQNISTTDLWINEIGGAAAIDTVGSYRVRSGGKFSIDTNRAVSIIGATTGQKFTATEF